MESLVLEVEKREGSGKGPARRERMRGRVPGVLYGRGGPGTAISMDAVAFDRGVRNLEGEHLVELKSADKAINGKKVLVRDLQEHPVTRASLHVDLVEVALDQAIDVVVPLHFVGRAEGVAVGGVLQPILREVHVSCLPTAIPEAIEVDVTPLGIHDALHVTDLVLPPGATLIGEENPAVVSVQPPTVAPAEEEVEEGAEAGEGKEATEAAPAADPAADGGDKS